jgi:hypothetical protein
MKKLSDKQLNLIKDKDMAEALTRQRVKSIENEIKYLEVSKKYIELQLANKRNELVDETNKMAQNKKERSELLKEIAKNKKLSPGWGFCPMTGEIKTGD